MKKNIFGLSFLAASLAVGMVSCQNEEFAPAIDNSEIEYVHVTANAIVGEESRTNKTEGPDDLEFSWAENDKILVMSEDGTRNLGVLTIKDGIGESLGNFEGVIGMRKDDSKVNIFYMGQATTDLADLSYDYTIDLSSQNASIASLTDYDIMYSSAEVVRADSEVSLNFSLSSIVSFAHFYAHMPEDVAPVSEAMVLSGKGLCNKFTINFANGTLSDFVEGDITVTPVWSTGAANEGDFYLVMVPSTADTDFTVAVGEKNYRASLPQTTYPANKIVCGGTAHGKDVYFAENDEWTVTYMNGDEVFDAQTANSFGPSMAFTAIAGPEKDAYEFLGWAEAENGSVVYTAGQEFTLNRPETEKTLYAVFEAAKAENMTINAWNNDGTDRKQSDVEYNHTWPFTFDLSNFDAPVRDGYEFKGWAATADSKTAITSVTFNYPETVKNVYAIWDASKVNVTVIGMSDDKNVSQGIEYSVTLPHTMILSENLDAPEKDGYTFLGWSATNGGSDIITTVTFTDKNELTKTVYAVWKKNSSEGTITAPGSIGTGY